MEPSKSVSSQSIFLNIDLLFGVGMRSIALPLPRTTAINSTYIPNLRTLENTDYIELWLVVGKQFYHSHRDHRVFKSLLLYQPTFGGDLCVFVLLRPPFSLKKTVSCVKSCTTWDVNKPCKQLDKLPTSNAERQISEPSTVSTSRISQCQEIVGCTPTNVPLWEIPT